MSTEQTYYTAIIFFAPGSGKDPAKYRNINKPGNFEQWATKQGAIYVNYYYKKDKQFSHRQWLVHYNQNLE